MENPYLNVRISNYMNTRVLTAAPDDGARSAYFLMREHGVRHLPVLDGAQLVGIISERDLRRPDWVDEAPDIAHPYELADHISVGDLMIRHPIVIHTYDSLQSACEILLNQGFSALPVLDKGEHLVGILTRSDLLRALHDRLLYDYNHGH